MDWRAGVWATGGFVLFATFLAGAINRGPSTTTGTLALDYILAFVGLAVFAIAIIRPKWLPGRTLAERESKEAENQRHASELALEGKKANARTFQQFLNPFSEDRGQRNHTDAMRDLAKELRLQREDRERQSGESDS